MKIPTPIITLLVGVALAVSLLISSISAVSSEKAADAAASASAAANAAPAVTASAAQSTAAASSSQSASASAAASASASASATGSFVIPPHANYDGEVQGNLGAVAIVVHDTFAIAYFCNGSTIESWFSGTPHDGKLTMQAKGSNGSLTANYALGHARGTVVVNGVSYIFSIIAVHKPSGLFQSIADVRGASIKAGWIVLANGTEVGSLNPDVNAANQVSQAAPKLNLSTLTADDDGTTITATAIDAETGSGF
jgi:hypothetical protein